MRSDLVAEIRLKIFLGILLTCALGVFNNVQADYTKELQSTMFETNNKRFGGECRTCGRANEPDNDYMIIRGSPVDPPYKYPWMVAIKRKVDNELFCGGAILNEYYILSAAHCYVTSGAREPFEPPYEKMEYISPDQISVAFLTKTSKTVHGPPVKAIVPHPGFHMSHMKHDIALLKLSGKLICNQFRSPICLPPATQRAVVSGTFTTAGWGTVKGYSLAVQRAVVRGTFTIAGWGTVKHDSLESSKYLREAKIKLVDFSECERRFPINLKGYFYCLVGIDDQGPCQGDSGGPMFNKRNGAYYIWGVASLHFSEKCNPDDPFTYAPVFRHLQWIKKVMMS